MIERTLLCTTLSFSILATSILPAFGLENNPQAITQEVSQQTTTENNYLEAILVRFKNDKKFDVGANQEDYVTLYTVLPIKNKNGELLIPPDTPIATILKPARKGKNKGTKIFAKSLIINGKQYPVNATGTITIPAHKITENSCLERAKIYSDSVSQILPQSGNFNDGIQRGEINNNNMIINGVAGIIGCLTPRSKLISKFFKNNEYIVHLEKPLNLDIIPNTLPTDTPAQTTQNGDTLPTDTPAQTTQNGDTPPTDT